MPATDRLSTATTAASTVLLRHATAADAEALRDLAALDSAPALHGPILVAEEEGALRAALALSDGRAIADPFHPTAALVDLLRAHGAARAARERRTRAHRRPRLALGV